MKIYLFYQDIIKVFRLPFVVSGSFTFDPLENSDSNLINVKSSNYKWLLYSTEDVKVVFNNEIISSTELKPNTYYILHRYGKNYLIFVEEGFSENYEIYHYNEHLNMIVGRDNNCNVVFNYYLVKGVAFQLHYINFLC